MTLTTRLMAANTVIVLGAFVTLVVTPATISYWPTPKELLTLVLLVAALVALEGWVIMRGLAPLREVRDAMYRIEEPPDTLPALATRHDEVGQVAAAFQAMVSRLADERRDAARRALQAQEEERARVARELHDEVGQDLALLMIEAAAARVPSEPVTAARLDHLVEGMRTIVDEVRAICERLRPGALEDLGLEGAVRALANDVQRQDAVRIRLSWNRHLALDAEQELVLYRVTQEALTNVVRHANARQVEVRLARDADRLDLSVTDDGDGVSGSPRTGILGMRERARLVRGHLDVAPASGGGTIVRLTMPLTPPRAS